MKLKKYLLLTFIISWSCWGLLLLMDKLNIVKYTSIIGLLFAFIGAMGPTIASIILLKKRDFKSIINYIFSYKSKTYFYLIIFSIILILSIVLSSTINKELPILLYIPLFLYAITFGGGLEELGWRGILQPELEKRMSYIFATILTGIIWSIWHLPLFLIENTSQIGESFILFIFGAILMSFWLSCIHKKTNSLLYCCIFHGLYNTLTTIFIVSTTWIVVIGEICLTILSIFIYYKGQNNS